LTKGADAQTVEILVGHFMIEGAIPSGTERELHIGEAYTATTHAIPSDVMYAALGHIHMPQDAPGSAVPARYSGSLMQLDFGEASQDKSVCLVELDPQRPARTECIPITSGHRLLKIEGDFPELERLAAGGGLEGAFLSVEVITDGPQIDLMDRVRAVLGERVMYVRPKWERVEEVRESPEEADLPDLYGNYFVGEYGVEPAAELVAAFKDVMADAGARW
jgi:exonuclease SbcD